MSVASPAPSRTAGAGLATPVAGNVDVWWFPTPRRPSTVPRTPGRAHPTVRAVLGRYLGRTPDPDDIRAQCEHCSHPTHGRPRLRDAHLDFNLSHIEGRTVVAVSRYPVGVATELVSAGRMLLSAAETVFSERERAGFPARGALDVRLAAWSWCAKEAMTKATGHGLAVDPTTVQPPPTPPPHGTWTTARFPGGRTLWLTSALLPGACVCSVAVDGPRPRTLRVRRWPTDA
ncbi:4'-phosphopantetheinyl transferase superfamily protein [Streptomyces massasporeus]|uniref:4'-phosphopantetheinyl transferase family protein n=1 Tax=Streptomyces massasporeus TaxID=67324 RepID=UPI0033BCFCC6